MQTRWIVLGLLLTVLATPTFAGTVESGGGGFGGSSGGGDASLAEQQTQTGLLTTIDADTGNIATNTSNTASGVGATADAAATAGSTGSLSAKQRLMTSQLDSIKIETSAILSRLMDVHVYVDYTPATGGCRMMLCGVGR